MANYVSLTLMYFMPTYSGMPKCRTILAWNFTNNNWTTLGRACDGLARGWVRVAGNELQGAMCVSRVRLGMFPLVDIVWLREILH